MIRRSTCLLLAALLVVPVAQAQWKWRDKAGQIHVSDLPPPFETPEKDILGKPDPGVRRPAASAAETSASAASGAQAVEKSPERPRNDPKLEARRKEAEREKADKAKAEAEKLAAMRETNCQRARSQIATLESGQRMVRINARGEREVLDDAARAQEIQSAREVADQNCR